MIKVILLLTHGQDLWYHGRMENPDNNRYPLYTREELIALARELRQMIADPPTELVALSLKSTLAIVGMAYDAMEPTVTVATADDIPLSYSPTAPPKPDVFLSSKKGGKR